MALSMIRRPITMNTEEESIIKERKLIYQGSVPIGHFEGESAGLDSDFMGCNTGKELTLAGVPIRWMDGIASALKNELENRKKKGGRVRVYQLMSSAPPERKFLPYQQLEERYGGADRLDYHLIFDGTVEYDGLNDLYELFTADNLPDGYTGRRLSMSDVIELHLEAGSILYYVDAEEYTQICWKEHQ